MALVIPLVLFAPSCLASTQDKSSHKALYHPACDTSSKSPIYSRMSCLLSYDTLLEDLHPRVSMKRHIHPSTFSVEYVAFQQEHPYFSSLAYSHEILGLIVLRQPLLDAL